MKDVVSNKHDDGFGSFTCGKAERAISRGVVGTIACCSWLSSEINLGTVTFTADHAAAAHRAYMQYGKGRHPAALNFGDTMTYAAAKLAFEPVIAVGNDFAQTDLEFDGVIGYWPNPT